MTAIPRGTEELRRCAYTRCNAVLVRKPREAPFRFKHRKTCGNTCASAHLHEASVARRKAEVEAIGQLYGTMKCADLGASLSLSANAVIGLYHRNFRPIPVMVRPPIEFPRNGCLYGFGDPGTSADFHFCGEPVEPGLSWCEHHRRVVYQPEKPGEVTL